MPLRKGKEGDVIGNRRREVSGWGAVRIAERGVGVAITYLRDSNIKQEP